MHFTVGVIHELGEMVDMLEVYNEYDRHTFNNMEEELAGKYTEETKLMLKDKEGLLHHPWKFTEEERKQMEEVTATMDEMYKSKEDFFQDYYGLEKDDDGVYGYWYNPQAKWDWYEVGGRWQGSLLVKNDVSDYAEGSEGVVHNRKPGPVIDGYMWVDGAFLKDIEWEKMEELNREKFGKHWEKERDNEQRFLTGIKEGEPKEVYLARAVPFGTYAVLNDKGWFDEEEYNDKNYYDEFIKNEDQNKFLTVVDCHI